MYLTAQHVRATTGQEGVSVYGYTHQDVLAPMVDWAHPDVEYIANSVPGRLMFARRGLDTPGGAVRSYLDAAAFDRIPASMIARLLWSAATEWPEFPTWPKRWWHSSLSLRFDADATIREAHGPAEYRMLRDELILTFTSSVAPHPYQFQPIPSQTLIVFREQHENSDYYHLAPPSRQLIRSAVSGIQLPAGMNITHQKKEALRTFSLASLEETVVQALTQLSLEKIQAFMVGVQILDANTGTVIWSSSG